KMRTRLQRQALLLKPLLEVAGPRENADAVALAQAMTGFLTDDAGGIVTAFFEHRTGRHPQRLDLDATFALILLGVIPPEEVVRAAAMIVVEVCEADRVVVVALGSTQIGLK